MTLLLLRPLQCGLLAVAADGPHHSLPLNGSIGRINGRGRMQFAEIVSMLSGVVVVCFGLLLIGLAALIIAKPFSAEAFLRGFASSAVTHYAEQGVRLIVGASMVNFAGSMRYPDLFNVFGWLIIGSTAGLLKARYTGKGGPLLKLGGYVEKELGSTTEALG